jgi:uncharacterized membrane protein YdjX (TVP38/TMEM64 family)
MKTRHIKMLKVLAVLLFIAAMVFASVKLWPLIRSGDIARVIRSFGAAGVLVFLGLWVLQLLAAVIPGEPFEVAAGVLYGAWLGLGICLVGVLIGTVIIYYGVKLLGAKSIEQNPRFDRFRFLKDPQKAERLIFILYLIPGTPKDILTYFGPFMPVKPVNFFAASVFGRIPSIITSTLAGAAIYDGNWQMGIVYFAIAAVLAVAGILIDKKIRDRNKKNKDA